MGKGGGGGGGWHVVTCRVCRAKASDDALNFGPRSFLQQQQYQQPHQLRRRSAPGEGGPLVFFYFANVEVANVGGICHGLSAVQWDLSNIHHCGVGGLRR